MEWVGLHTHYSLFPQTLNFSFPPKLGGFRENEIKFNEIIIETSKMPIYIQPFI